MDTAKLTELFRHYYGMAPHEVIPLPPAGSHRKYFRLSGQQNSAIGVYNDDLKENRAFIGFTQHFLSKGLHVPGFVCRR